MEMSMGSEAERYNFIREKSGLSKKDFAESLGLSLSMNYQISSGRLKLPRELLERLSSEYSINLHWFLTGNGQSGLDLDAAEIELYDQEAAAGWGRDVQEYLEKSYFNIPFSLIRPHRPENLRAVYVSGDSMIDERINDGDIVIFNTKQTEGNGIYVVSIGNSLLVKRVDFDQSNKAIVLISANQAYEPRRYSGYELEDIRVAGRVVACYHRV
jgi:SOS-response transcriptional repressor LexA